MAVFADFYIGKTHIIINDDYFCKPEEVPGILNKISRDASLALQAEARKNLHEDKTA